MNFVRLLILALVVSTVVYFSVAWFLRSTRRERLEKEWDADNPGGDPAERRRDVEEGVQAFTQSFAYRALWLIYILPVLAIGYTLAMTNWN
ncbi:MAG: hypothetical protein AAFO72_10665 [Pseudomonadota bacterium]